MIQEKDTIFLKIFSVIIGMTGGFGVGVVIATVSAIIFDVVLGLFNFTTFMDIFTDLMGVIGVIAGAIISYFKRSNLSWRIFFIISTLLFWFLWFGLSNF